MLALGLVIVVSIGLMAVHIVSPRMSWLERIGLSFPIGMGIQTMIMALIDMCSVPLTSMSMIVSGLVAAVLLAVGCRYKGLCMRRVPRESNTAVSGEYNLVWLLLVCLIVYFEYMNFSKCMYFPTFDRDSLAGFDTIGYVIAQEHTFGMMSLFDTLRSPHIHNAGSYITYAPMTQLGYAYVYLLGAETSKLMPALMYLSFIIAFYGAVCRVTGRTVAAAATLLMMITPEMISFSSMSATNCIHAVSASLGVIYVALWFRGRRQSDLVLGSLLLALNVWTRTDGVVFVIAALVVGIAAVRQRRWVWMAIVGCAFIPMIFWGLFCKVSGFYAEGIVIMFPFWDAEKAGAIWRGIWSLLCNTDRYGVTFLFFLLAMLGNVWFLIRRRDNLPLLAMMVLALALYMAMLYQIDYKWDTMGNVLAYSAKRFLFCFVPLAWFGAITDRWCVMLSDKIEKFLS
ncbi:MAG: hypothetical protein K2L49_09190 [Muribaculaceae bacterium]|nr:hypothetical protein [Muribaculaceae bacterium]